MGFLYFCCAMIAAYCGNGAVAICFGMLAAVRLQAHLREISRR